METHKVLNINKLSAILFDCDGVLADSEPIVNQVNAIDLNARGWAITPDEAGSIFLGLSAPSMVPIIEAHVGSLPADWVEYITQKVIEAMERAVVPVSGATELLATVRAAKISIALASNSSRMELTAKLNRLGFTDVFGERILSYEDVPRPKPHPDIYLAAAEACGVPPTECVVIEDSATGVKAGVAAGCTVLGFAQVTDPEVLLAVGASAVFDNLSEVPGLLGISAELVPS
jgi:HAD superfamily hydrolase (TIGR01509 family)